MTGLNICDYQLKRAREYTQKAGLEDLVDYIKVSIYGTPKWSKIGQRIVACCAVYLNAPLRRRDRSSECSIERSIEQSNKCSIEPSNKRSNECYFERSLDRSNER